jgi:hypothetical protein
VTLRFAYQDEPLTGPAPPSLSKGTTVRWRPLIPLTIIGPTGITRDFGRAVFDPAADDTVLPIDTALRLGVRLLAPTGHGVRWGGQLHALRFGEVDLLLTDNVTVWCWRAVVGFSPAPLRYPILGQSGCLQFIDARFLGANLIIELDANRHFPGTQT